MKRIKSFGIMQTSTMIGGMFFLVGAFASLLIFVLSFVLTIRDQLGNPTVIPLIRLALMRIRFGFMGALLAAIYCGGIIWPRNGSAESRLKCRTEMSSLSHLVPPSPRWSWIISN